LDLTTHEEVKEYWDVLDFNEPAVQASYIRFCTNSTYEEKHGRKETRDYAVSDDVGWLVKQFPPMEKRQIDRSSGIDP
jgi:hypothetical protein